MALQIRRGTDSQRQSIVLAAGEPFFVTNALEAGVSPLWVGDGTTQGGVVAEGAINLDEMLDVTISSPQNNQLLAWSTTDGVWKNQSNVTIPGTLTVSGTTSFTGNITSGGTFTGPVQTTSSTVIGDNAFDPYTINSNSASVPNSLEFKKSNTTSANLSSDNKVISITTKETITDTVTITGSTITNLDSTVTDGQLMNSGMFPDGATTLTGYKSTTINVSGIGIVDNKIKFSGTGLKVYANGAPITEVADLIYAGIYDGFNYYNQPSSTYQTLNSTHNFPRFRLNFKGIYFPDNLSQSSSDAYFSLGSYNRTEISSNLKEPIYPIGTKISWPATGVGIQYAGLTRYTATIRNSTSTYVQFGFADSNLSVPPGTPFNYEYIGYNPIEPGGSTTKLYYLRNIDSITNPTTNWFKGTKYDSGIGARFYVYPTKADALADTNRITLPGGVNNYVMSLWPDRPDDLNGLSLYYAGNKKWAFTYADAIANNPITRNDIASWIDIDDSTTTNASYKLRTGYDTDLLKKVITADIKLYFVNSSTTGFNIHYDQTQAQAGVSLGTSDGYAGTVDRPTATITSTPTDVLDPYGTFYLFNDSGSVKIASTYANALAKVAVPFTGGTQSGSINIGPGPGYGTSLEFKSAYIIASTTQSNASIGTELVNADTGTTDLVVKLNNAGNLTEVGRFTSTGFSTDVITVSDLTVDNDLTVNGDLTVSGNQINNSSGNPTFTFDALGNAAVAGNWVIKGNNIRSWNGSASATAISLDSTNNGNVTIAGDLIINGNDIKSNGGTTAIQLSGNTVTIPGNLTVNGTTTTVNSTNLDVADNMITLNKNETGAGITLGIAGIEIERGTLPNVQLRFNESNDRWEITSDGTNYTRLPNQNLDTNSSPQFVDLTLTGALTATSNSTFTGDLAVNGGDITTTSNIGNLFNTNATTVNIGNAATTEVNLGVDSPGARIQVKSPAIVGANTTQAVFNTVATTVNAFGAATAVNIGATTGTTNIKNNLDVDGDINIDGGDLTTSSATGNLFNTNATTVNIGNAATTEVNLGNVSQGKTIIKSPTLLGANATQAVFNTVATTINAFGAATAINVGAPSGSFLINNAKLQLAGNTITAGNGVDAINLLGSKVTLRGNVEILGSDITLNQKIKFDGTTLVIDPDTNRIGINTDTPAADLHVNGTIFGNDVVGLNNLGTNTKTLILNYDNGTDTNDGFLKIQRGGTGADVSIKWNESTDRWQFTNDGSTYNNMLLSSDLSYNLDSLSDVVITTPTANQLLKYNGTNWVNSTVSYDLDSLSDVVVTSSTTGQLLTYNGTNWVNNNVITATSATQTIDLERSGAFTADTSSTIRSALRLTKKFTDVSGAPSDHGGPAVLFNVQGSDNTTSSYAALSSNRSATGDHSVSVLTSTDNFTTSDEAINITYAETSFPNAVSVGGAVSTSGVIIDSRVIKNTATQTYTSTSQQVFGNVPIATYRSIKYTWQISRGSEFQMLETMVIHDGTNAYITTFGDTRTGANLANFDVDISGSNMRILVTPTSTASTVLVADYTLFNI